MENNKKIPAIILSCFALGCTIIAILLLVSSDAIKYEYGSYSTYLDSDIVLFGENDANPAKATLFGLFLLIVILFFEFGTLVRILIGKKTGILPLFGGLSILLSVISFFCIVLVGVSFEIANNDVFKYASNYTLSPSGEYCFAAILNILAAILLMVASILGRKPTINVVNNTNQGINTTNSEVNTSNNPFLNTETINCPKCNCVNYKYDSFCKNCGLDLSMKNKVACAKCNTLNNPDSKYCFKCGSEITKAETCKNCGNFLKPNDLFCNKCGFQMKVINKEEKKEELKANACPSCGFSRGVTDKFCKSCGFSFESNDVVESNLNRDNKCFICGAHFETGTKFCENCGNKLD